MQAIYIRGYGDLSKIEVGKDLPIPKLETETDVLVEIHAASLNPIDYKLRDGALKALRPKEFPLILGYDLSGIVLDVGEKVTKYKKGDEVGKKKIKKIKKKGI